MQNDILYCITINIVSILILENVPIFIQKGNRYFISSGTIHFYVAAPSILGTIQYLIRPVYTRIQAREYSLCQSILISSN